MDGYFFEGNGIYVKGKGMKKAYDPKKFDNTIESELWAGDQANTKHEERAAHELYRRRLRIEELEAMLGQLRQRISELEAALKPFARYMEASLSDEGVITAKDSEIWLQTYDDAACCVVDVTVGDFRTAAKLLGTSHGG